MSTEQKKPQKTTLGLVIATMVASSTSIGCSEMHQASDASSPPDAPTAASDASPDDAGAFADAPPSADAPSPTDVAIALDAPPPVDALFAGDDADLPDGYYPDGIRG